MAYNPEVRKRSYEKYKTKCLEYSVEYNLKRKFNLSLEDYNKLLNDQNNVCAICKSKCTRALAVDHNHETGKNRGLLCNKCNRGIGYLQDSIDVLKNAIEYLNKY